jgi:hypothetical protein
VHDHSALKLYKAISSTYDVNSTYQKNYNAKRRKKRILEHHLLKEITVEKPQGRPPPPSLPPPLLSPAVNHPPHAKMKHTGEADSLVPEFAARWHARKEHLSKLYSTKYEERESRKRMTY